MKKDLISISDLKRKDIYRIFEIADSINKKKINFLKNKNIALIFEKPSLRTRVSFEVAINQLGGNAIYLLSSDIQMGKRESIGDVAKNLSLWLDGIVIRTFQQERVSEIAKNSTVPVINALSDLEHPSQIISDLYTILKEKGNKKDLKIAFIGDGNNVCHSLLLGASLIGLNIFVSTPKKYEPNKEIIKKAKYQAENTGSKVIILNEPELAVKDADVIYTDVWISMGQEREEKIKLKHFYNFQISKKLIKFAKKDCLIMHCLPAHIGQEIEEELLYGENSIVLKQAKNRLPITKAILLWLYK